MGKCRRVTSQTQMSPCSLPQPCLPQQCRCEYGTSHLGLVHTQACQLKTETITYEEKEQQLVNDCVKELSMSLALAPLLFPLFSFCTCPRYEHIGSHSLTKSSLPASWGSVAFSLKLEVPQIFCGTLRSHPICEKLRARLSVIRCLNFSLVFNFVFYWNYFIGQLGVASESYVGDMEKLLSNHLICES